MKRLLFFKTCCAVMLAVLSANHTQASVTLDAATFPDNAFRNAVATAAGVNDGGSFNEATLTTLDVSGKGIQSIKGVEMLTALTKFVAANNDIQFANFTNNPHLEWLDLSNNDDLQGFNSTPGSGTASNHWITLTNNMPLAHLDLSNCNIGYFVAIYNGYHVTTLTWLSLANNPAMAGWSNGIAVQTGLVYCDLTNTAQTSSSVAFTASHNKLETLILKNNSSFGYSSCIQYLTALKYLDISNCDIYFREGSSPYYLLHYLTPTNNPNLETLLVANSKLGSLSEGLSDFPKLKTVDISGNPNVTSFWVNQCPMLEKVDITGCTGLTSLNLIEDNLPPSSGFTLETGTTNYSSLLTVSLNDNRYSSVGDAMSDLSGINSLKNLYLENNSGFNGLNYTMSASDCGNLVGLDLGKNGFKSFTAQNLPSSLKTLLLGYSTSLESVEIHNAAGLTSLGTVNGLGASNGLYLLNDPALTHLDLESISSPLGVTALSNLTGLTYLNLGNTGQAQTSTLGLTSSHTNLDTLILRGNSSFGYSSSIQHLSALKYLDISNCDIFFRTGGLLDYLKPANNPNLETVLCSNSKLGTLTEGLTGFTHLKTVDVSHNVTNGNVNMTQFWVNGSPSLESLDITGDTHLTYLKLNNDNLPRNNFTLIGGSDCSALNSLYLNDNNYSSVSNATSDFVGIPDLAFLYLQNNSGFAGGPLTLGANDCGSLTGLDLGNNGFTSFSAPSLPSTLSALMLGKNPNMTRLEMHNNPGITKMTADTVMSAGSGLYLLGNTALTYMDISGDSTQCNYFQRIGNNFSLQGVPIDTIKGSYNKFYTFRNLTTVPGGGFETYRKSDGAYSHAESAPSLQYYYYAYWPTMAAREDSASLEQLTGLRYLDLSHCQLKDSVYLHKNTELRYLDVSHNRSITRYATSPDKGKGYRDSGGSTVVTNRNYPDYKKYTWLADTRPKYPYRQEAYDQEYYTMDYNDTTGLYILDLMDNDKLEYLDISYTGIQQTALTHCHVSNARFIWIQDLHNLKYLYADYNGMRSMGIGTLNGKHHKEALKSLERLSVIGMRGADVTTMQGSMNFLNNGRCPNLHYVNISYSDFDSIGVHNPSIDTLIVRGNPIHHLDVQDVDAITYIDARECAFKQRGYDPETNRTVAIPDTVSQRFQWTNYSTGVTIDSIRTFTMNGARVGGVYTGAVTTPYSGLRSVRAHHRPHLTTLLVNKSNALTDVYCHFDPKLTGITGFDDLAYPKDSVDSALGYGVDVDSLNLVWVNDDSALVQLNLTKNINLQYLHAYNDKALGQALGNPGMDLTKNKRLVTAWVSNSLLERFVNDAGEHLDTLKIWQNPQLSQLNVTGNPNLRYFDLRNCMVRNLNLNSNSHLTYFDCSNQDSITAQWTAFDNYGFTMPRNVPTSMYEPGKNSIADLIFTSKQLETVHADNNDLYCLKGLNDNAGLKTLTYSYNHINAIDLSGCPAIETYNCYHNVRGLFMGELATWKAKLNDGQTNEYEIYYLQLKKNAGDAINNNDTYLGHKCGQDSLETANGLYPYMRSLEDDGFDPDKVIAFTVNAAGPYTGNRGPQSAPRRETIVYGPDSVPDPDLIYGKTVVLRKYDSVRNYCEYLYDDGRPNGTRGGSGFGLAWGPPSEPTAVEEITVDGLSSPGIVSERYYDVNGIEHSSPVSGVNIVVRQMDDGSTQTVKIIR